MTKIEFEYNLSSVLSEGHIVNFVKRFKIVVVSVGIAACGGSAVSAADFAVPGGPSQYDWSGIFVGGSVGGAWNPARYTHFETAGVGGAVVNSEVFSTNGSSLFGGLHVGAQHQFDNVVVGAEAGYSFFNATDSQRTNLNGIPRTRETKLEDMWHVEARLGYAFDRVLPYVKAGYANSQLSYTNTRLADGVVVGQSQDRVGGYLLGAGVDVALTENWVLGAEYTFINFQVGSQQQFRAGAPVSAFNGGNNVDLHTVGLKLSYKF